MKKVMLGISIGIILCSGIVYATNYLASDISYTPTDEIWKVNNVNDAINDLYESMYESNLNKSVTFTYSGGGYMRKDQRAKANATIVNDNYKKITVSGVTAKIVFNYIDGTSSTAVSVAAGDSLEIPDNVSEIKCSSSSTSIAGDDGWGGQSLTATTTITLE